MTNRSELYELLKRPVVSEKTTALAELSQYVFEVDKTAGKVELAKAFELAFPGRKVNKVRLVKVPAYSKRRGQKFKKGLVPEGRKAIFSITGEPIELFSGV